VLDFYAGFSAHRAISLKPDGKDILSVRKALTPEKDLYSAGMTEFDDNTGMMPLTGSNSSITHSKLLNFYRWNSCNISSCFHS
jgi:hypothetical protein